MLNKLKDYGMYFLLLVGGVLAFLFKSKSDGLVASEAENRLNKTKVESDNLDSGIKDLRDQDKDLTKKIEDIENSKKVVEKAEDLTPSEVEDYWND